ncbi:MAG TPA: DUF4838 domain-containing protein, partial [Arachidicoccus soli]|nr:DUF4838 domain-containing protein [Arachidicoccus soli]
ATKTIILVAKGNSSFEIVLPKNATKVEKQSANILQHFIKDISGASLPIIAEDIYKGQGAIFIGHTMHSAKNVYDAIKGEGFVINSDTKDIYIVGGSGQGTLYGIYSFLEDFLGCHKFSNSKATFPQEANISIPTDLHINEDPDFVYREAYYPQSEDDQYLQWHRLQRLDDLWGLWGHSSFKIISPQKYFSTHPEYFGLVNGKRQPLQLCVSNEDVFKLTVDFLRNAIKENPDALYWSISPQDGGGFCTCSQCEKMNEDDGGPQGSWLQFVNRIAEAFPNQKFVMLAYGPTAAPTLKTKPASNVYIMLSSIDALRQNPLEKEPSASIFRKYLEGWERLTHHIFIWDYTTQFTNYIAPFPDYKNLAANLKYFKKMSVEGVFEQGSGDTYSDMAEYNSYLLAALLWDVNANVANITQTFMNGYYGKAGRYINAYVDALTNAVQQTSAKLDIYGNPVSDYKTYLSPQLINQYSSLLDSAEIAVDRDTLFLNRVYRTRLSLEYTVLQQSLFFGTDKYGYLIPNVNGNGYIVNPKWPIRVNRFVSECKSAGVKQLAEDGITPSDYQQKWNDIFKRPWIQNLAFGAKVNLKFPYSEDYPAKKEKTLTDGLTGGKDFSENWLFIYGNDLVATLDLGQAKTFREIKMNFLQDARHYIFNPSKIKVEVSNDDIHFTSIGSQNIPLIGSEDYDATIVPYEFNFSNQTARYIRITAICHTSLPTWLSSHKKPSLCCDEIYVLQ